MYCYVANSLVLIKIEAQKHGSRYVDSVVVLVNRDVAVARKSVDLCVMKIEHLAMWVRDLEKIRAFYETYFGATANDKYVNPHTGFSSYFLSFPDDGPRLELMQMPGILDTLTDAQTQYMGLSHVAFSVGSTAAVDDLTEKLRQAGYVVAGEPRRTGDGYYESVVLDPEQNRIEITV